MKKMLCLFIILILVTSLYASQDELFLSRGKAGLASPFLNSQFDPYGVSTGASIVSFADTIESIFWNPAGLCMIESSHLSLSGSKLSLERYFSYISFAKPVGENLDNAIGFTVLGAYVGDIVSYDKYDIAGDKFYYMGNSFIFTYSRPMNMTKFGFNVKVVRETIKDTAGYGGAIDMGLLVTPPLPVQLGISIRNFPGVIKWQDESKIYTIDNAFQVAIGYKSFSGDTKIGISFLKETGEDEIFTNIGGEFTLSSFIDIRFGFFKGKFAGGVGLNLSFAKVNYAFYNDALLDLTEGSHLISTVFSF